MAYKVNNNSFVSVLDFGADPTGVADSTTAFQNAMANGPTIVPSFVPGSTTRSIFRLANCIVPNGATLIGEVAGPPYGLGGGSYKGKGSASGGFYVPAVIAPLASTTTRIFNVDGKAGITFRSLLIDASDVSGFSDTQAGRVCDGISAGSSNINLDSCSLYFCNNGLGGQVSGSTAGFPNGTWIGNVRNCIFNSCVVGVGDLLDCHISDCWFGQCLNGVNQPNSAANTFVDCRFEWCGLTNNSPWGTSGSGGNGMLFTSAGNTQIIGCYFDTNGNSGISINGGGTSFPQLFMITGCFFQSNGVNVTTSGGTTLLSTSCHINLTGSAYVTVTGCNTWARVANTGVYGPFAAVNFTGSGSNVGLTFVGNNLSGYSGTVSGASQPSVQNSLTLWRNGSDPASQALFTGSISAATMTVSGVTGTIAIGQKVAGPNVLPLTRITAGSGTSWTVTPSQTVSSTGMMSYSSGQGANGLVVQGNFGTGAAGCDIDSR